MRMLYVCVCVCVCEVILFSCDVTLGASNVNVCKRKYYILILLQAAETKGRQGRTSDPLQNTQRRTCHAKATGRAPSAAPATQKPPAERRRPRDPRAYIRPLALHQVPRLPRKSHRQSGGDQRTPCRAYARPLAAHQVPHLPRKSQRRPTDAMQGIRPTPCSAPSPTPATQKPAETNGRHAGHTSDPLQCTKSHTCRAKAIGRAAETKGRHTSDPLQCTKSHACHVKATGRAAETKGRQDVHPTPCSAPSPTPAVDQGTPGRTSDPLQSTKCRTCRAKATGRAAETKGRQGVHPTPCSAPSPTPAMQKPPTERRRPRDVRAYIRLHQVPRLPRKKPPAERRRPRDARAYIRHPKTFHPLLVPM